MARVKVSEHSLHELLNKSSLSGISSFAATQNTSESELLNFFGEVVLVVKVDQGIKKRGLQGLVAINLTAEQVVEQIQKWVSLGWQSFIVVPFFAHDKKTEHYLSLELTRQGWHLIWGEEGGINIEDNWANNKHAFLSLNSPVFPDFLPHEVKDFLQKLLPLMLSQNIVFLECNPFVILDQVVTPLDLAGLVDDTAATSLKVVVDKDTSTLEQEIARLDASTPASLKCRLVNKDGAIWMLLSGGGASLCLADEVADQNMGDLLGNYGEYSGSPTTDDTAKYAEFIIKALLDSKASKKALIIAGGVANFTDVKKTFLGIITALKNNEQELVRQGVKVYVRRGGPNELAGLKLMSNYLTDSKLLGSVYGHDVVLTDVVKEVKEFLHA